MFTEDYPNLAWWITSHGWIELGEDEHSHSWVRILDIGGTCYEDEDSDSLEEAMEVADRWTSREIADRFGEEPPRRYDDESDE